MEKCINMSDKINDIVKEAEDILSDGNTIYSELKFRQMVGQLLIDEMQSNINNWDKINIPGILNYEYSIHEILEEILEEIIPDKFVSYLSDIVEFRNSSWKNNLNFRVSNSQPCTLNMLSKDGSVYKREIIDNNITLETKIVYFDIESNLRRFRENKLTLKELVNCILNDIEKYLKSQIETLQEHTLMANVIKEKPIKIGFDNCFILIKKENGLCFYMKIGVGMLGV